MLLKLTLLRVPKSIYKKKIRRTNFYSINLFELLITWLKPCLKPNFSVTNVNEMKNVFLAIFVLMLASCTSQKSAVTLRSTKVVDGVKIGMTISKAVAKAGKTAVVQKAVIPAFEGQPTQTEYKVLDGKTLLYTFNAGPDSKNNGSVFRIVIYNSKYITPEGVSVGSTVKDVRSKSKLKAANFNQQDGLFVTAASFDGGFLLNLNTSKEYSGFDYVMPTVSTLPDELTVKAIVLF